MSQKLPYVVIGCSAAGLVAVSKIKMLEPQASVVCLSQELELPYNKCFLVDWLSEVKKLDQVFTKPLEFFKTNNISLYLGKKVISLDRSTKKITCFDGSVFHYKALLIATGAQPRLLFKQGQGVFSFYTLSDAQQWKEWITQSFVKDLVIVGSGLTGLEVADALKKYPVSVTIIEKQDRVLSSLIDQEGSALLQSLISKQNISVKTNTKINDIVFKDNRVRELVLSDGTFIKADAVLGALGSIPSTDFAQNAGLEVDGATGALITDEFLQTNDPVIFAAGDVALVTEAHSGKKVRTALWPDALQQGIHAAHAMVGQPKAYKGVIPFTTTSFFGVTLHSAGIVHTDNSAYSVLIDRSAGFQKIILDHNKVVKGFISLGSEHKDLIAVKRSFLNQTSF